MNLEQLRELVVKPALRRIPRGYSDSAVIGFLMTAAHESARGEYLRQVGCCGQDGAFGLIQMEKATHDDCWLHSDTIWNNANQAGIIHLIEKSQRIHPDVERLTYDLDYNVFMWRQQMFRKPEAFPSADNLDDWSRYLKQYWNSVFGAATDQSYKMDYEKWQS